MPSFENCVKEFTANSGHLGLQAFHHVLTDPRTQNIPLILETPTFDNNRAVWGTEIAVLIRLSGSGIRSEAADDVIVIVIVLYTALARPRPPCPESYPDTG
ncbi:hypothetical protein CPB84DRAFT_1851973 [Gymnopilus junonius]|uniref:Uncharacterized protein n=1 Tax=Gymnopilus junonius TaxID=109634 RepID=A0A9P5TH08_GYMJU|nr:hypothetical protein CPB84DRAFT_1851973 [Gymnopilus junonius]